MANDCHRFSRKPVTMPAPCFPGAFQLYKGVVKNTRGTRACKRKLLMTGARESSTRAARVSCWLLAPRHRMSYGARMHNEALIPRVFASRSTHGQPGPSFGERNNARSRPPVIYTRCSVSRLFSPNGERATLISTLQYVSRWVTFTLYDLS